MKDTQLALTVRREMSRRAAEMVDYFAEAIQEKCGSLGPLRIRLPLRGRRTEDGLEIKEILRLYQWHRGSRRRLKAIAPHIRAAEEQLLAYIERRNRVRSAESSFFPGAEPEMHDSRYLLTLSAYISFVFIPAVTALGEYTLGVHAVRRVVQQMRTPEYANVFGAGAPAAESESGRYFLAGPMLWSLVAYFPHDAKSSRKE